MNIDVVPLLSGAQHTARKAFVMQALSPDVLGTYLPVLERIVDRWLERWNIRTEFAWLDELEKMATGMANALLLGELTGSNDAYLEKTVRGYVTGLGSLPIKLPFTSYTKALRCRDQLLAAIDEALARHRQAIADKKPFPNITTELIQARVDGEALPDHILRNEMLHLYFAIYTGVSLGLAALCLGLGQHRAIMQQARAEVMNVCPDSQTPLTMAKLNKCHYLQMLTMEARRVNPVLANTFLSLVKETTVFNNYQITKGWQAMGGLFATMNLPEFFDLPSTFDPERFSEDRSAGRRPNTYCPHGASSAADLENGTPYQGHRCGGEPFIDMLMKVVTVHLLRDYTWTLLPQNLAYTTGQLFPAPSDGLKVHFQPLYEDD
ncbi:MAG: hypothetical protein ETSY1_11800 [Candidatus Entotheonella factor]|uniref:Cytochrome P450 n=1 Tax=Entotheonella factor TaxID=1429438 RepID=W4LSB5_ENTF1|nr:MAG: hypothetical protein ETSY1_11800 [Candidatus Entotheonella factor]